MIQLSNIMKNCIKILNLKNFNSIKGSKNPLLLIILSLLLSFPPYYHYLIISQMVRIETVDLYRRSVKSIYIIHLDFNCRVAYDVDSL